MGISLKDKLGYDSDVDRVTFWFACLCTEPFDVQYNMFYLSVVSHSQLYSCTLQCSRHTVARGGHQLHAATLGT